MSGRSAGSIARHHGTLWYARGIVALPNIVEFVLLVPAGAVLYLGTAFLVERQFDWGIQNDLASIVGAVNS